MGRTKLWSEQMQARFAQGTFEWIESALEHGEDRTDFVREAVVRELRRRLKLKDIELDYLLKGGDDDQKKNGKRRA
jgi:hypothetical protein